MTAQERRLTELPSGLSAGGERPGRCARRPSGRTGTARSKPLAESSNITLLTRSSNERTTREAQLTTSSAEIKSSAMNG